jgi:hypothetical protein
MQSGIVKVVSAQVFLLLLLLAQAGVDFTNSYTLFSRTR